jgi:glycosyltransferase involved in cell wall biosynthesis
LRKLAQDLGVLNRVVFLGLVPYQGLWGLAVGAAVGVSLVAGDKDLNWRYSAGAINKRFEYMAVGLPQVANSGPGMEEIIEKPGCGLLVDPTSAPETGRAITRLLEDPPLRRRLAENARKAHLSEFNCERQFAPVLEKILGWCRN